MPAKPRDDNPEPDEEAVAAPEPDEYVVVLPFYEDTAVPGQPIEYGLGTDYHGSRVDEYLDWPGGPLIARKQDIEETDDVPPVDTEEK